MTKRQSENSDDGKMKRLHLDNDLLNTIDKAPALLLMTEGKQEVIHIVQEGGRFVVKTELGETSDLVIETTDQEIDESAEYRNILGSEDNALVGNGDYNEIVEGADNIVVSENLENDIANEGDIIEGGTDELDDENVFDEPEGMTIDMTGGEQVDDDDAIDEHLDAANEETQDADEQISFRQVPVMLLATTEQPDIDVSPASPTLCQNIIIQHMDITEPLTTLRELLEKRLQCSLANHEFWLQDTLLLEPSRNLVTQCIQGTGTVQINMEVKSNPGMRPRLNIVDILKPADEFEEKPKPIVPAPRRSSTHKNKVIIPLGETEHVTRWIVDQQFRRDQERLNIPFDPLLWSMLHVKHWINWAIKKFSLVDVNVANFNMTGEQLCSLQHDDFIQYIPVDTGDIFWTHLELLKKCKFVAVMQQSIPQYVTLNSDLPRQQKNYNRKVRSITIPSDRLTPGNRTGNNGQIQLWQFLLELLTDKDSLEFIQWIGDEGEFKLINPELVAQLWGQRKNKLTMNYEKLSRALRYYYDGDMIAKVHGKRFVYKFVCDLQMLLGYTASELNLLVNESANQTQRYMRTYELQ